MTDSDVTGGPGRSGHGHDAMFHFTDWECARLDRWVFENGFRSRADGVRYLIRQYCVPEQERSGRPPLGPQR